MKKPYIFYHIWALMLISFGAMGIGMSTAVLISHATVGKIDSPSKAITFMIYSIVVEFCGIIGLEVSSN